MVKLKSETLTLTYRLSEWVALFVVMHYCVFRFWGSTSFGFAFPELYYNIMFYSVMLVGLFRLAAGGWLDYCQMTDKRQRLFHLGKLAFALLCLIPFYINVERFGYKELMYLPFMAYCLYGAKPERVMKAYAICIGTALAATVLSSLAGAIPNYLYLGSGKRGVLRGSYGIVYPTDFAAYLVFIFLFAWGSGRFKNWRYTALAFVVSLFMAYVIYTYPHGINGTICSLLIAVVIIYDAVSEKVFPRYKATRGIIKVVDWLTIGAFPLFAAMVYGLTWLYGKGNGLAVRIDQLISNRLFYIWYSYEKYGLHWFGTLTPQKGGGLVYRDEYEFIDSSYGVMLIRFGTIITVIFAIVWVWMTLKAVRTGHRRIALVMAVIAFHAIIEQRFAEINILLVMPLCCFDLWKEANNENKQEEKKQIRKLIRRGVGVLVTGVFLLFVPKLLSDARSMVILKEWSGSGERTQNMLIFWLVCFVLLALFGYFLYDIIITVIEKKKLSVRTISGITVVILTVGLGSVWINTCITEGVTLYESQLASDKTAVQLVLDCAEEPVYVGQTEEIYKRSFNGISDHIVKAEEIARKGRGSVFLEHDNEGVELIRSGARYTEISPYTGLFTYDDAVIEALTGAGYRFHGYYSAEKKSDFEYLAKLNDLPLTGTGKLQLAGDAHTLRYGLCIDQYSGTYSVNFSLQLTKSNTNDPDAEICTLRASAIWGKTIWTEHIIHIKDLDEDGSVNVTLNYRTGNTGGVEYLVFCRDGMELNIEDISWKRTTDVDTWAEYTPNGLLLKERYFTAEGEPMLQSAGHYGVEYEYANGNGLWTSVRYLDVDGKSLKAIFSGYAQIEREYNNLKKVTEERYLDVNGDLCLCTSGYACYNQTYDSRGNTLTTGYYDTEDKLVRCTSGYAFIERRYDDDGNRIFERYLDENNEPVILSGGYAEIHRKYDKDKHVIQESYYGTDGEPIALSKNQASVAYDYDDDDNIIHCRYMDINGDPVMLTDGFAELYRSYNDEKRIVEERYFDSEGNPVLLSYGYAAWKRDYDNAGNIISEQYLDTEGQSVCSTSGIAEIRREFNGANNVIYEAYYDTNGNPAEIYGRYAKFENKYDDNNNLTLTYFTNAMGEPIQCGSSYFHEYLQSLKGRDITIFISIKDEGTKSLTGLLLDDLKEIGVTTDLSDKYHNSFYAVITPNHSIEDFGNTEEIHHSGQIGETTYTIVSAGWSVGNTSSIIINGEEYSKNARGMNFVIVDNKTKEVIESVAFDTYDFEMRVTR